MSKMHSKKYLEKCKKVHRSKPTFSENVICFVATVSLSFNHDKLKSTSVIPSWKCHWWTFDPGLVQLHSLITGSSCIDLTSTYSPSVPKAFDLKWVQIWRFLRAPPSLYIFSGLMAPSFSSPGSKDHHGSVKGTVCQLIFGVRSFDLWATRLT